MKLPKTFGACADRLHAIKEEKGKLNKELDALDEERKAIEEHLIQNLPKDDSRGVLGKVAKAIIKRKDVPSVKDWDSLYKHILKTKDFSLMQRRVADTSIKERWEAGKQVPGVEAFTVVAVSVTKI